MLVFVTDITEGGNWVIQLSSNSRLLFMLLFFSFYPDLWRSWWHLCSSQHSSLYEWQPCNEKIFNGRCSQWRSRSWFPSVSKDTLRSRIQDRKGGTQETSSLKACCCYIYKSWIWDTEGRLTVCWTSSLHTWRGMNQRRTWFKKKNK